MSFFRQLVNTYFRIYSITDEDRKKTAQYKANAQRAAERAKFVDMDSYLESLQIEITISPADEFNIGRIAQMTQKTNQFNLTTHRLTEQEIRQKIDEGWRVLCLSVKDRFGDNGITGAIFITPVNHIDNLLLSCRVLGKGIEQAFVSFVRNTLHSEGINTVSACFSPSAKNEQAANFYDKLGFYITCEDNGTKQYKIELDSELQIKKYYHIKKV
jgi:FkbH-like protein